MSMASSTVGESRHASTSPTTRNSSASGTRTRTGRRRTTDETVTSGGGANGSAGVAQLAAQLVDLVSQAGGVLEPQVGRGLVHLFFERLDEPAQLVRGEVAELVAAPLVALALHAAAAVASRRRSLAVAVGPQVGEDVGDGLADRLRIDAVLRVVRLLQPAAAVGLRDGVAHRIGEVVGVHHDLAVDVSGGAADHLDERRLAAQEAFLVGVEDGDERDLGEVEPLTEEVDADEHVELTEPKIADDLDALDRVDVGVQVPHAHAELEQIVGEVFRHLLRERGDEHTVATADAVVDLLEQVVDLALGRFDDHLGVDKAG